MLMYTASGCRAAARLVLGFCAFGALAAYAQVSDPGVRTASTDGGPPLTLPGLSAEDLVFFKDGLARFTTIEAVSGTQNNGLGPRFNSNQCSSCHSQPFVGGSSPTANPLFSVVNADGASNQMPWFIVHNGPVREARFVQQSNGTPDGGVHDLFVITGRADAGSCNISQPSFLPAGNPVTGQGGNSNVVFRIPTPTLGSGLIEAITDSAILANQAANTTTKQGLGVAGHPNRSGNDGTITRFGWKAQNKSLLMFAGEAYNVEMGISNDLFPQERDETPNCQGGVTAPNDTINIPNSADPPSATAVLSDIESFAIFMRMLAPPQPAAPTSSSVNGRAVFASVGCSLCHTPALNTAATSGTVAASGANGHGRPRNAAVANTQVPLFSDLLVHHMGTGLADGITQGAAGPDEFRTAPLWGLGQRVYFLHDGRTSNLIQAIQFHASSGSEANQIVQNFAALSPQDQQDLINFLRSL